MQGDFEKKDGQDLQWKMMRRLQLRYHSQRTKKDIKKVNLITFGNEERAKGKGFMKRVKELWDQYYLKYQDGS